MPESRKEKRDISEGSDRNEGHESRRVHSFPGRKGGKGEEMSSAGGMIGKEKNMLSQEERSHAEQRNMKILSTTPKVMDPRKRSR